MSGRRSESPRSVYIHVPFCRHRCGYCNFPLVAGRDELVDDFLGALAIEIPVSEEPPEVETVYLGGGTPSRLPPYALRKLLELVETRFQLTPGCEFTMEVNPEDLDSSERREMIRKSRINRVSLGVQAFDAERLRQLDRQHTPDQIDTAIATVRELVPRFSLDLIFGVAGDSLGQWRPELAAAIETGAGHLSTYELTIEKGTPFWTRQHRGDSLVVDPDQSAELYEATIESLTGAGFEHYEVSSFARPGQRSAHNQVYWSGASWLGHGPGAAGLVDGVRYTNHRGVTRYLREVLAGRPAATERIELSRRELALDRIVFGLRRIEGVDLGRWGRETGLSLDELIEPDVLERLVQAELLIIDGDFLKLTRRGLMVGDSVCGQILQAAQIA